MAPRASNAILFECSRPDRSHRPSMQLPCPSCTKTLEFSGERPRFCSFCGQSLTMTEAATIAPDPDRTAPPSGEADTLGATPGAFAPGIPETIGGYRLLRRL